MNRVCSHGPNAGARGRQRPASLPIGIAVRIGDWSVSDPRVRQPPLDNQLGNWLVIPC
jgi:hypothetical protein